MKKINTTIILFLFLLLPSVMGWQQYPGTLRLRCLDKVPQPGQQEPGAVILNFSMVSLGTIRQTRVDYEPLEAYLHLDPDMVTDALITFRFDPDECWQANELRYYMLIELVNPHGTAFDPFEDLVGQIDFYILPNNKPASYTLSSAMHHGLGLHKGEENFSIDSFITNYEFSWNFN